MAPTHAALFTHLHADVLICLHSEIVMPCSQLDLSLHSMKIEKKIDVLKTCLESALNMMEEMSHCA